MTTSDLTFTNQLILAMRRIARCPSAIIYQAILQEISKLTQARGGSLFTFERDGLVLRQSLDQNHVPEVIPLPLRPGSAFQRVMADREPFLVEDLNQHNQITTSGWEGYNDGSLIILPIMDEHQNISAIISLHNKVDPPFVQADLDAARLLAAFTYEVIRAQESALLLHKQGAYHRTLFESAPYAIIILDQKYSMVDANPRFFDLFGYRENQIIKKTLFNIIETNEHETINNHLSKATSTPLTFTIPLIHNQGRTKSMSCCVTRIDINSHDHLLLSLNDLHKPH